MLLWLRRKGLDRPEAARVLEYRWLIGSIEATVVRSDGHEMIPGGRGRGPHDGRVGVGLALDLMDAHDLLEPIEGETAGPLWQPNLHRSSERTVVLPWVMAPGPVRAAHEGAYGGGAPTKRPLRPADVVRLYPGLTAQGVEDATELERRLHAA